MYVQGSAREELTPPSSPARREGPLEDSGSESSTGADNPDSAIDLQLDVSLELEDHPAKESQHCQSQLTLKQTITNQPNRSLHTRMSKRSNLVSDVLEGNGRSHLGWIQELISSSSRLTKHPKTQRRRATEVTTWPGELMSCAGYSRCLKVRYVTNFFSDVCLFFLVSSIVAVTQ